MKINVFQKKNGELMIFINDDAKKSFNQKAKAIGISDDLFTSKLTDGQKNLLGRFFKLFDSSHAIEFTGNAEAYTEQKVDLACGLTLFITDVATVGGQRVESDGAYLLHGNKLLYLGEEYEVD